MLRFPHAVAFAAVAIAAACSDPNELADPSFENVVDTVTLYSLTEGPLVQPSAFAINARGNGLGGAVRTWEVGSGFEFAYSTEPGARAFFLPIDVLGLLSEGAFKPGLLQTSRTFDEMTKAPLNGYITSDTVVIAEQERYFVRTGINACAGLGVPLYAKLEVLDIDSVEARVTFRVLSNRNCGYRSLLEGFPKS
jgi:hypothetical protein